MNKRNLVNVLGLISAVLAYFQTSGIIDTPIYLELITYLIALIGYTTNDLISEQSKISKLYNTIFKDKKA